MQMRDPGNGQLIISGNCKVTGEEYKIMVPKKGYYDWQAGDLIQNAMPSVSKEDREFLKSGISPKGWEQLFRLELILDEVKEEAETLNKDRSIVIDPNNYVKMAAMYVSLEYRKRNQKKEKELE